MGNVASCAPSIISNGVIKVLSSDGTLEIYTSPLKAAELMLENPNQFVCDSNNLQVGLRIQGLLPEEQLEIRRFYFLLPVELLYSVLTIEELGFLNQRASKALKHGSLNFAKIFPVIGDFCMFPTESKTASPRAGNSERYSRQRSWSPALETIIETSTS